MRKRGLRRADLFDRGTQAPLSLPPSSLRSDSLRRRSGVFVKSPRGLIRRAKQVAQLVRRMRQHMPWLMDSDLPVARQWADLELIRAAIVEVLNLDGPLNKAGVPRRLLTELRWITNSQLTYSRELGMTPASRAMIQATNTNSAIDVALQCAVDRQAEEVRATNGAVNRDVVDADTRDSEVT